MKKGIETMLKTLNKNQALVYWYLYDQTRSDIYHRGLYGDDYTSHSSAYGIASDINREHSLKTRRNLAERGLEALANSLDHIPPLITQAQVSRACGVLYKLGLAEKTVSDGRKKVNLYRLVDDEVMK